MNIQYSTHQATNKFSQLVIDYLAHKDTLTPFYKHAVNIEGIKAAITARKDFALDRNSLVNELQNQYSQLSKSKELEKNLEALKLENTFTITTAHQALIFTGPLYFIYKILHAIKLAKHLQEQLPAYKFVPVFYIGSEDADLEEIGTFNFRKNKYNWQSGQTGATGRMHTESLSSLVHQINNQLNPADPQARFLIELWQKAYLNHDNLAQATQFIVNELFGKYGLVAINPDSRNLKAMFTKAIAAELKQSEAHSLVEESSLQLAQHYKVQAHARPINLFYLHNGIRARIEKVNNEWLVVDSEIKFNEAALDNLLATEPECFSPNVILRGVFQESILPNVAFIGGGGELAYWLQLKKIFELHKVPMPVLVLRQSFQIVPQAIAQKLNKLGLSILDLFKGKETLAKEIGLANLNTAELESLQQKHEMLFEEYLTAAQAINKSLAISVQAHKAKSNKIQARLMQKFIALSKRTHAEQINKVNQLINDLYLDNALQERSDNFMDYYLENGTQFFDKLLSFTKPFGDEFGIINE